MRHWPDRGQPFDIAKSKVVQWLISQPEIQDWLFQRLNSPCILVSPTGLRKSMTIDLVTRIARSLLPKEAFVSGVTSNQALFLEYLNHPDKLWLIDEGNVSWTTGRMTRRERGWP